MGASRDFDALNDDVNCGSGTTIDDFTVQTIAAWVYTEGTGEGARGRVACKHNHTDTGGSDGWGIRSETTARVRYFRHFDGSGGNFMIVDSANNSVPLNAWHHVAIVWDGSVTASNLLIYVDGATVAHSTDTNGSGSANSEAAVEFVIGNMQNGARTFDGQIAYVHYYNVELTTDEINEIMNLPGSVLRGLQLYIPMFGEDATELDLTGNGNDGVATSSVESFNGPPVTLQSFSMPRTFSQVAVAGATKKMMALLGVG